MSHLTDREIQAFLDGAPMRQASEIEQHLQLCHQCQNSLEAYQEIYRNLKVAPQVTLPADFKSMVLAQISVEAKQLRQSLEWLLFAFAALFSLVSLIYIIGVDRLKNFVHTGFGDSPGWLTETKALLNDSSLLSPENISFTLMAAAVLVCATLLDKFLFSPIFRRRFGKI